MNKIKVKPEGRKNMWEAEKTSLKEFIKSRKLKTIHNFIPSGMMILGADHEVKSVLADIDRSSRNAVFTDDTLNMGHSMALIFGDYKKGDKEKLECYNIGEIKLDDLEITK